MVNNNPLPFETGRGLSISYLGKNLYSKYNPLKNAFQIAKNQILDEETLYIIPSPLLLYGVEVLLKKLPESSYLLGIEIDQQLMKMTLDSNHSFEDGFKTVRLESKEQLKIVIEDLGTWRFRRCEMIPLNYGYNLYKEKYNLLFNFSSYLLSTFWRNRLTINKLGKTWIKNIFSNLKSLSNKIPTNNNKPILICGAGASLEHSINTIRELRNSLYIMAVDTALSALLESHIIPDSIFALESQFYNLGDFYDSYGLNIDLITDITGYPPVCRKLTGIKYFFSSDFFDNKLLKRIDNTNRLSFKIPPLGSVGVAAVYSALKLFKSEIFLTGLDFSFIPGKSHSRGTPYSKALLRKSNRLISVNCYNLSMSRKSINRNGKIENKTIQTDSVLESYAIILQDILGNEKRVYDLSQEGFPLGIPIINKDEFIEKVLQYRKFDIKPIQTSSHKKDLTGFLESEKNYLLNLINEWESFVDTKDDRIPISLMKSLQEVDYVYIDFPDRLPHPKKEISFISRAVTSARFYIAHINKLLK